MDRCQLPQHGTGGIERSLLPRLLRTKSLRRTGRLQGGLTETNDRVVARMAGRRFSVLQRGERIRKFLPGSRIERTSGAAARMYRYGTPEGLNTPQPPSSVFAAILPCSNRIGSSSSPRSCEALKARCARTETWGKDTAMRPTARFKACVSSDSSLQTFLSCTEHFVPLSSRGRLSDEACASVSSRGHLLHRLKKRNSGLTVAPPICRS